MDIDAKQFAEQTASVLRVSAGVRELTVTESNVQIAIGTEDERLQAFRVVRDSMLGWVEFFRFLLAPSTGNGD